ncbi:MAG: hypothetical protein M4579_003144 [Chaenotheca gracillima]|nr:MAG: hypothetical protein M4579_003144 [Chaenotheca gracillima]
MEAQQPPLNYQASSTATNAEVSTTLPTEVVQCLKNTRFLHLATCDSMFPHVSLMNYTYLPSNPYTPYPTIVMTTNPSSKKTLNLIRNPHVSLLVHDWVSHRPPTTRADPARASSPPREVARSSLASLLLNLNTSALSSISATINGDARMLDRGTEEEKYFKDRHLENNTFNERGQGSEQEDVGAGLWGMGPQEASHEGDGGRGCFIEGEEVRVVVVRVREGRIADWKGGVKDWTLAETERGDDLAGARDALVNGLVGV